MHDEAAGHDRDGLARRAHRAAAGPAEIDFRRVRMAMVGADLTRLPAGDGHVTALNGAENLLDVMRGIPLLLAGEIEDVHGRDGLLCRRRKSSA
jgi:hypothetical protein